MLVGCETRESALLRRVGEGVVGGGVRNKKGLLDDEEDGATERGASAALLAWFALVWAREEREWDMERTWRDSSSIDERSSSICALMLCCSCCAESCCVSWLLARGTRVSPRSLFAGGRGEKRGGGE